MVTTGVEVVEEFPLKLTLLPRALGRSREDMEVVVTPSPGVLQELQS